jgi:glycosyltransferase involved in cell wall biosynthesis
VTPPPLDRAAGHALSRYGFRLTTAKPALRPSAPGSEPLPVSVVIPAYNREKLIARALESVQRQHCLPAEVIVVDDGSTDATSAVAERFGARVVSTGENRGAAGARRMGVDAATQDWVALLDSDDEWLPWMLAALWPQREGHVLVTGGALLVQDERIIGRGGLPLGQAAVLSRPELLAWPENFIPAAGVLAERRALRRAMEAGTPYRYSEDLATWLRLLQSGSAFILARPVVQYHVHDGQKSATAARLRDQHAMIRTEVGDTWLNRRKWVDRFDLEQPQTLAELRPFLRPAAAYAVGVTTAWRKLQRLRWMRSTARPVDATTGGPVREYARDR